MQEKKISKSLPNTLPKIREPDEWARLTAAGIQVADENGERNLVRLIDLAEWLSQSYPRDQVLRRIFHPAAGLALGGWQPLTLIYLLKANTSPVRLMDRFQPNDAASFFWERLDGVDYFSSPDAVGVSLQEAWEWFWPGVVLPGADPEWDREFRWRHENRRREAKAMLGYLKRLAIDASLAHLLWGWGTAAVGERDGESASTGAVLIKVPRASDWERLIDRRNNSERHIWTVEDAKVIQAEERERKAVKGVKGVRQKMAEEMSAGGKSITHTKLFQAMREKLEQSAPDQDASDAKAA